MKKEFVTKLEKKILNRIIIDTDPGQDDAVAILLALASPELEVVGITCVAGNVELELTCLNARKICELANITDVPIFKGSSEPLRRNLVTAKHVHGRTGLDGADLPEPTLELADGHAVDFIIDTVMSNSDSEITVCALGPLTNIAMALEKKPELKKKINKIIMMGGGFFEGGNITPAAEFNIYVDPEAANIVMSSKIPIVMLPLDLTHKVLASSEVIKKFRNMNTRTGRVTANLLDFFGRFDTAKYGSEGAPLHDPNVIAYLLEPSSYEGKLINVEIETNSDLTLGMTVADWWGVTNRPKNVFFVRDTIPDRILDIIISRLSTLP